MATFRFSSGSGNSSLLVFTSAYYSGISESYLSAGLLGGLRPFNGGVQINTSGQKFIEKVTIPDNPNNYAFGDYLRQKIASYSDSRGQPVVESSTTLIRFKPYYNASGITVTSSGPRLKAGFGPNNDTATSSGEISTIKIVEQSTQLASNTQSVDISGISLNGSFAVSFPLTGGDVFFDQITIGNDTLTGLLQRSNTIEGGDGNDTVTGGNQSDWLDGGTGQDKLLGGAGNDTFVIDDSKDSIIEKPNEGTDIVRAFISYILPSNIENLTIVGEGLINGTGNSLANQITGNSGNNILDGAAGADTLTGGLGSDTYIVDNTGDVVTEEANGGNDLVQSSITYTLGNNLERLMLAGVAAIHGTGNTLNNTIIGNKSSNILIGGNGSDSINGGEGDDIILGIATNDSILGRETVDKLTGGKGKDKFILGSFALTMPVSVSFPVGVFYADGATSTSGKSDYAWITDFGSGDQIALKGKATDYILKAGQELSGVIGTFLYLNDGTGTGFSASGLDSSDEMIAFVQTDAGIKLNLADSKQFAYFG